ncbi:MAG: hypothetical protein HOC71_09745 [Candidatus Latescibacteria bacterium]|jgi:hypothetical protein|nr:hypothetical protein [Candidatus Latescibacterota bacterium]
MTAPYRFKKGWDREKLAEYILSLLSFVAKPSTVSDDLGSDLYCTLFRLEKKLDRDYPFPLSSFAIQIKSNKRKFNFSSNINYLQYLEIPFFWGVLNENDKQLSVFSGENLPVFFSHVGEVKKLYIKPLERNKMSDPYDPMEGRQLNYTVMFPKILKVGVDSTKEELNKSVGELQKYCSFIHKYISTRKNEEYIFESYNGQSIRILAGPGSVNQYRNNFMMRLAENFYNLEYKYKSNYDKKKIIEEFNIYEDTYKKILKVYDDVPSYLNIIYSKLKKVLL